MPDSPLLRIASVARRLPAGGAFSGLTAAWLHGLDVDPCNPIEVTIPEGCGVSARVGMTVLRERLAAGEVVERHGWPVTAPVRTVTDLGRRLSLVEAVVVADLALHAGLVNLQSLGEFVSVHPGIRGIAQLRKVVDLAEPAAESPMETRLRLVLVLGGLPRPEAQVPLHDAKGRFLGRPDLLYRKERLILEYDGGIHRDQLVDDNRRQNKLLAEGYSMRRFTGSDVYNTPQLVVLQVKVALEAAARGLHLV